MHILTERIRNWGSISPKTSVLAYRDGIEMEDGLRLYRLFDTLLCAFFDPQSKLYHSNSWYDSALRDYSSVTPMYD